MKLKKFLSAAIALSLLTLGTGTAVAHNAGNNHQQLSPRIIAAQEKMQALYKGAIIPAHIAESELYDITNNILYGEIFQQGQLMDKEREMILLAELASLGNHSLLRTHVYAALNAGLSPAAITDSIYHTAPYTGAARALEAIEIVNAVFAEKGIALPESTATVTEADRWEKGKAAQTALFGDLGDTRPIPGEVRLGRSYLPDYCFGDFYTRDSLTLEQHELLTWVVIAAMGGADPQLKGHTLGNKNAGKSKTYMMEVATLLMLYMGYPRTLNALSAINSVYEE